MGVFKMILWAILYNFVRVCVLGLLFVSLVEKKMT